MLNGSFQPVGIFALANIIVIARLYAMYDKDKRILGLLRWIEYFSADSEPN